MMTKSEKSRHRSALGRRDFVKLAAGAGAMTTMLKVDTASAQVPAGGRPGSIDVHARVNRKMPRPFREYIRRFHYDTITYYPETLRFLIDLVGSDRVVIGTDNFALMDLDEPNALVEQLNLSAADHERIMRGNALRLLKLQR